MDGFWVMSHSLTTSLPKELDGPNKRKLGLYASNNLVDVGRGAKESKFQQLSGDFPLNHNKQK